MSDLASIHNALDSLEKKLQLFSDKADGEVKSQGVVTEETKRFLDLLGKEQLSFAERLVTLEQKAVVPPSSDKKEDSPGEQFTKSTNYKNFATSGQRGSVSMEVKNTVTNTIGNTLDQMSSRFVGGAFRAFTLEDLLTHLPATSDAVQYVREAVWTNAAAETAEGAVKPQSSLTTTLVTEPVATVAHYIKISKQLSQDAPALVRYIDTRLRYGVNLRVENQIMNGDGLSPNISGFTKAANFTPHGYTSASLTALGLSPTNRFDLIGKIIGDCALADYQADAVLLNPTDWWTMRLAKDNQGRYILGDPGIAIPPSLFGLPVVATSAVTPDNVAIGAFGLAASFYDRDALIVEMTNSDQDDFIRNLMTLRAERRCMLAVERPAAIRYGDLTPA